MKRFHTWFTIVEAIVSILLVALFVLSVTTFFSVQNRSSNDWNLHTNAKDLINEAIEVIKFYPVSFDDKKCFLIRKAKESWYEYFFTNDDESDSYREGKYLDSTGNSVDISMVWWENSWYRRSIRLEKLSPYVSPFYYRVTIEVSHPNCNDGKQPCEQTSFIIPLPVHYE